jgi:hypothetical protein
MFPILKDMNTSREKPTAGAPKLLIPGELQLASDTNASGNALSLALPLANVAMRRQ